MRVGPNKRVTIDYTLSLPNGELIDSSLEKEPFTFVFGKGEIIPGIEKAIEGLQEGDTRDLTIPPEDAYGEFLPEAVKVFNRDLFPPNMELSVGLRLSLRTFEGETLLCTVKEIKDEKITLDFNHPLAGKTIKAHVTVKKVCDLENEQN